MTIDQAIQHLSPSHVLGILNSGVAYDAGTLSSLSGRAMGSWLCNDLQSQAAYAVLATTDESAVRQACWPVDRLTEACKEGSGRAMAELQRRGVPIPQSSALMPAWL